MIVTRSQPYFKCAVLSCRYIYSYILWKRTKCLNSNCKLNTELILLYQNTTNFVFLTTDGCIVDSLSSEQIPYTPDSVPLKSTYIF